MAQENASDTPVESLLQALGIRSFLQWDVLAFVHRHRTSLVGAETIARLLGYANDPVVTALDMLVSLGLVGRSRPTRGVRFYQFTLPPDSPRRDSFARLTALAESRAGRLRLNEVLRPSTQAAPDGRHAADGARPDEEPSLPIAKSRPALAIRQHSANDSEKLGGEQWLKVS